MIDRFEIIEHGASRPDADRLLFCDGTEAGIFRPDNDLELSHWRPNHTPAEYRAGTSTEICFRFVDNPRDGHWTAAINNHIDVDGILSVFVLVHSQLAIEQRATIVAAAEIGDFWGWGDVAAQRLFQGMTLWMRQPQDPRDIYLRAFERIPAWIDGSDPDSDDIDESLAPLREQRALIERGAITRRELADHLSHYVIPSELAGDGDDRAAYVPAFNEAISTRALLWPQVRARWDRESICLVSTERPDGWFHDIWFPGYLWADTKGWWQPLAVHFEGMKSYRLEDPGWIQAFEWLQREEAAEGHWSLGGSDLPWGRAMQEQFPLVGRFLDGQGRSAVSKLKPERFSSLLVEHISPC